MEFASLLPTNVFEFNETTVDFNDGEDPDAVTLLSVLLVGIFLSLLIFLSVAGNILVCIAIYTDRGLRRIGNLFLASLAIADMLVAAAVMTFAGVNDLLGYWVFGEQFCDTWVACDVMCSTASILNLCAISLDRYIHIKDPLSDGKGTSKGTKRKKPYVMDRPDPRQYQNEVPRSIAHCRRPKQVPRKRSSTRYFTEIKTLTNVEHDTKSRDPCYTTIEAFFDNVKEVN